MGKHSRTGKAPEDFATWGPAATDSKEVPPHVTVVPREEIITESPQQRRENKPRKPRRVFMWVFLTVQALFILWIVAGAQAADTSTDAGAAGATIGVGLIILIWAMVDIIMTATWAIVHFARRTPR